MSRPSSFSLGRAAGLILFLVFSGLEASARRCESLFESPAKFIDPTSSAEQFLSRHIPNSGLKRLTKPQLVTLFTLRDRIRTSVGAQAEGRIATDAEAVLVSQITRSRWSVGDAVTMVQFENKIALPAFKLLAFKASVARTRLEPDVDPDELYQASIIGLLEAIRAYRADSEFMFSTWAFRRMGSELNNVARESTSGFAMATTGGAYSEAVTYFRIARDLRHETGRAPTDIEIANRFNALHLSQVGELQVTNALSRWRAAKSVNSTYVSNPKTSDELDEGASHEVDAIAMQMAAETPYTELETRQRRQAIAYLFATLTPREQRVLGLRFGLDTRVDENVYSTVITDPYTLDAIGDILDVTKERVRQIEAQALRKMKHPSRSDVLQNL